MKYLQGLFEARLNRVNFFLGLLIAFLVFPGVLIIMNPILEKVGIYSLPLLEWFPLILFIIFILSISIRRLHDSGRNWYHLLFIFVPLANLLIPYWLASVKGDDGKNKYGNKDEGINIKRIMGIYI